MRAICQLVAVAGLVQSCSACLAEDLVGPSGVVFKLKQKNLAPGPRTSPDGKLTVMIEGLSARLIDAASGKPVALPLVHRALRADSRITAWAFSLDGKRLAVGTGDARGKARGDSAGEVRVWDVATGKLLDSIHPAHGDIGYVHVIAFSADGKSILVDCLELSGKN